MWRLRSDLVKGPNPIGLPFSEEFRGLVSDENGGGGFGIQRFLSFGFGSLFN